MKKETGDIIDSLKQVLDGEPWYGKPVMAILNDVDPVSVYKKPAGSDHSMIDLLYHLIAWTVFTVNRLEKDDTIDPAAFESLDWRTIDPKEHTWENGVAEFKAANDRIIKLVKQKDDDFLENIVDFRTYNFRHLLNGLIQHHIYHSGQIAYISKISQ
jgi:uncharacterized damage-inducible protein DinB